MRRQCVAAGDARAQGGCAVTRRATGAQDGSKFVFVARPLRVRLQVRPRQREGVALSRQPHGRVCAWSRGVGLESAGARAAGERRVLGGSAATRRRPVRGERGRAVYRRRWAAGACRALHRCRMPVQDTSADGCPGRAALISQSVTARSGSLVTAPWSRRTCRLPRHVVSAETLRHALGLPPARGHAAGAAAGPDPAEPTVTVQRGCLHGFIAGPRPPFAACCLRPLRSDTAGGLWLQADGVQRRRPARLLAYSGKLSRPRGACRGGGGGGGQVTMNLAAWYARLLEAAAHSGLIAGYQCNASRLPDEPRPGPAGPGLNLLSRGVGSNVWQARHGAPPAIYRPATARHGAVINQQRNGAPPAPSPAPRAALASAAVRATESRIRDSDLRPVPTRPADQASLSRISRATCAGPVPCRAVRRFRAARFQTRVARRTLGAAPVTRDVAHSLGREAAPMAP